MGLFEFIFRGGRQSTFEERVWLTAARRMDDVVAHVRAQRAQENFPVVVTHFKATREAVVAALSKAAVKTIVLSPPDIFPSDIRAEWRREGLALVMASDLIPFDKSGSRRPRAKDPTQPPVTVHLAEHYPTPSRDDRVLSLDGQWAMPVKFMCYTSLEDPLMLHAGAERVREIVKRLGMDENTPLSHHFLNQSIRMAQRALAKQVKNEQHCDSQDDWFKRNARKRD